MPDVDEDFTERTMSFRPPTPVTSALAERPAHLLLVLSENAPPRHFPLHALPLTIGRTAPSELTLEGSTVSRRHCRLEQQGDQILLTDLDSTNGTFVNGERAIGPIVLEDGARITIGVHALGYHRRSQQELAGWEALDRELGEANDYVQSILPLPITSGPVLADWFYQPCTRLGGDAFGYQMLDTRCFAAFIMDVAGHGAGAALFSMTVATALRQRMLPEVDFRDPAMVIRGLNRMFPMERHNNLFFTMWYGVMTSPNAHSPSQPPATIRHFCCRQAHRSQFHSARATHRSASPRIARLPHRAHRSRQAVRCSCSATAYSKSLIARTMNGSCRRSCRCCR